MGGFWATGGPWSAKSDLFLVDIFKPKWNLSYIDGARLRDSEPDACLFPPYGRSVKICIVPWATPVLYPVGLGGARAWFCCCGSFGRFSACLTWFQQFRLGLGQQTASGSSLPHRLQSPFTTRLPEAPRDVFCFWGSSGITGNGINKNCSSTEDTVSQQNTRWLDELWA